MAISGWNWLGVVSGDDIDLGVVDDGAPVAGAFGEAELAGARVWRDPH